MGKKLLLLSALICALTLALSGCGGGKEATATSMRLSKAEGEVQVNDAKDKSLEIRENLALYSGYNVGTKAASYGWVDLDNVKLVKLDESSQMGIENEGSHLKVQLKSGNLFFHVTEPLRNDESMEIRTSTLALGIRGTCGWVETSENGAARVALLEGKVECTAGDKSALVSAGEMAYLDEGGEMIVEQLDASVIPAFVTVEIEQDETLMKAVQELSVGGADDAVSSEEAVTEEPNPTEVAPAANADAEAEEPKPSDAAQANTAANTASAEWKKVYLADLNGESMDMIGWNDSSRFNLIDIDSDGIPEVFENNNTDTVQIYLVGSGEVREWSCDFDLGVVPCVYNGYLVFNGNTFLGVWKLEASSTMNTIFMATGGRDGDAFTYQEKTLSRQECLNEMGKILGTSVESLPRVTFIYDKDSLKAAIATY